MKESCGVFGVHAPGGPVAQLTYDGLFALQHRGQESAGMAVSDGETITVVKDMGLVSSVFDTRTISALPGDLAIGHTRYSTTGASEWRNAQPVFRYVAHEGGGVEFALGHNGNLTNTAVLAESAGMLPGFVASDSDLVAELVAAAVGRRLTAAGGTGEERAEGRRLRPSAVLVDSLREVLPKVEGAFSLVLLTKDAVVALRDPNGFRPLCLGRLVPAGGADADAGGWVVASETPALDIVGASFVRELDPGELVWIDTDGVHTEELPWPEDAEVEEHRGQGDTGDRVHRAHRAHRASLCIFEFVYFARPDSRLYGREVHGARRRMGELLAREAPVDADLVMGVPESGVAAAEGYARESGIPYGQGLVKNRYMGRTFITPGQAARDAGVRRKLNPLRDNIAGKRLVVVDDSIVRGTTQRAVARMLREGGATEVHLRISSPPLVSPCFYGIDIPSRSELVAARLSVEEIAEFLGVDSLAYLSLENLVAAIDTPGAGFCTSCMTGRYPTAVTLLDDDEPPAARGRVRA